MHEEKIYFTLNLSDAAMEKEKQAIHLEINHDKNANFYIVGKFSRKQGRNADNFTLTRMDLEFTNICGQNYEPDAVSMENNKVILYVVPSNKPSSGISHKLELELTVNKLFDFEIRYRDQQQNKFFVGTRVCNIQVA